MLTEMLSASRKIGLVRHENTYYQYDDPAKLASIIEPHRQYRPLADTFVHKVSYNHNVSCRAFDSLADFVYLVREPVGTLSHLVGAGRYTEERACLYYEFRLRRLCEMARRTPTMMATTFDRLVSGEDVKRVRSFVGVRETPNVYRPGQNHTHVHPAVLARANRAYAYYLADLERVDRSRRPA